MPDDRPFHHGNLRAVLLDQAETVLRERGIDALSLRELARAAGVSHGAPRSHFIDRAALLDALAERGFVRLADEIRGAAARTSGAGASGDGAPGDGTSGDGTSGRGASALRAAASAYVRFAVREPALLDLMFSAKVVGPSEAVAGAAERLFATMTDIMSTAAEAGAYDARDVGRLTLLLSATVQGISALVTSGRITTDQSDALVDDAITVFLAGASAGR
ncbi:TetR/AcrR family transcriptional regulator [Streptomyces montanisoli]|uniref:TetR/AcrR family transcriptional regulator n=1 Tax=Streptomyces montanisoli TaxID=2798581 RepID=A0A940MF37_9ACTN|nr:TetR/AcrR family transcriptional regulator [Streptomyces montanisoli]MBP0457966.1 TetR/AcrR family transcriptional regulator [Streptomyces montanisoli]